MNEAALTLAYRYVALALMLAQVNFFAAKVGLKLDRPITEQDVRGGSHVSPPKTNDFGGSILTDAYFFGFGWGHLANFRRNDFRPDSAAATREMNTRLSRLSSLVDTNGAFQLSTNWLAAIGVDLSALETKHRLNIIQWRYRPEGLNQSPALLPVYRVEWRGSPFKPPRKHGDMAVVTLTVLGSTKELIELHILDDTLFLTPGATIGDQVKLLSIPDPEFRAFDALQRSNLVSKCLKQPVEGLPAADRSRP